MAPRRWNNRFHTRASSPGLSLFNTTYNELSGPSNKARRTLLALLLIVTAAMLAVFGLRTSTLFAEKPTTTYTRKTTATTSSKPTTYASGAQMGAMNEAAQAGLRLQPYASTSSSSSSNSNNNNNNSSNNPKDNQSCSPQTAWKQEDL